MKKIRAIYIGDVRFEECPVFELDEEIGYFVMLKDKDFRYEKDCVYEDDDFLIFTIENDRATMLKID
ncbi:hypothetical protein [Anaeromicrobium sediminis]|uniref:Uncharacterized protein n=1 Tax=Anaeromicrobium sediminis TaxID=1478221 RepID=A0A267MD41_9FIRM|nr:hypothetical protein [Anaeromicrobium sediminis]PAB57377.1 hypothetical protein CCE28_18955 [Anaeromicrobium sediminis]